MNPSHGKQNGKAKRTLDLLHTQERYIYIANNIKNKALTPGEKSASVYQ